MGHDCLKYNTRYLLNLYDNQNPIDCISNLCISVDNYLSIFNSFFDIYALCKVFSLMCTLLMISQSVKLLQLLLFVLIQCCQLDIETSKVDELLGF